MTDIDEIWEALDMHFEGLVPSPYIYPASFDWYLRMYAMHKKTSNKLK